MMFNKREQSGHYWGILLLLLVQCVLKLEPSLHHSSSFKAVRPITIKIVDCGDQSTEKKVASAGSLFPTSVGER